MALKHFVHKIGRLSVVICSLATQTPDTAIPLSPRATSAGPRAPEVLLDTMGAKLTRNFNGRVTRVELRLTPVANIDAFLRHLSGLKDIESLTIIEPNFRGDGIAYLAALPHLQELIIESESLTAASFALLKDFKALRQLEFHKTGFRESEDADILLHHVGTVKGLTKLVLYDTLASDDGLRALNKSKLLETLVVVGPKFKGAGLVHLSELDNFSSLTVSVASTEILENLRHVPKLRHFGMNHRSGPRWAKRAPPQNFAHLGELKHLESLTLPTAEITDELLAHIGYLPSLKALNIHNARISDRGLGLIGEMGDLEKLELGWNTTGEEAITDAGLEHLKRLTQLETLNIGGRRGITNSGLAHLTALKNIRSLTFYHQAITDDGMAYLAELPKLQTLHISYTEVSDDGIERLSGLKGLEYVNISNTRATLCGLFQLYRVNSMKDALRTAKVRFTEDSEGNIDSLSLLSILLGDGCAERLGKLTELRNLLLLSTGISNADLVHLKSLAKLESLDLCCDVGGAGLSAWAQLENLKALEITAPVFLEADLEGIAALTGLEHLTIDARDVVKGALRALTELKNLKTLDIRGIPYIEEDFQYLSNSLPRRVRFNYRGD